ncbi:TRAP transporter small permease [Nisaea sediminum]|uniref:TRAP transporter small permease n=1 Tax=Nisaea sediminum TaxID=2775867 RepID=UPI0018670194|nr:TRAP transporter small permease [Nisaea sediminum]
MVILGKIRVGLDRLYLFSGAVAALFLIAILGLIVLQMLARWTGEVFPGAAEYVGYCMAAASFLAFAHALQRGAHIRVGMLFNVVPPLVRRLLEVWCLIVGSALAWYFVWYAGKFVYWSWKFKDVSQGQDMTLLWMPQSIMVVGAVILAISLTDFLVHMAFAGRDRIVHETVESHAE